MTAGNPLVPEAAAERLGAKVATLPTTPGVYLLKDGSGRVLYVGKATNLRSRVRSYLSKGALERPHLAPYFRRWQDVDVVTTKNSAEETGALFDPRAAITLAALARIPAGSTLSMSWQLCGFSPQWRVTALAASTPTLRG